MTGCLHGSSSRSIVCSLLTWVVREQTMPKTSVLWNLTHCLTAASTSTRTMAAAAHPPAAHPPSPSPHAWPLTEHHPSPVPPSDLEALTQRASGTMSSASPTFISLALSQDNVTGVEGSLSQLSHSPYVSPISAPSAVPLISFACTELVCVLLYLP
ncbi:hypothetical protein BJV74DRAFT_799919 [Russula compacta]|nr:hypothetical protein BJV74DRAFT_799919 [Russula compacta]